MPTIATTLIFIRVEKSTSVLSEPKKRILLIVLYSRAFEIPCSAELSMGSNITLGPGYVIAIATIVATTYGSTERNN